MRRILQWTSRWGCHSNERALCNARTAGTTLSCARVERDEVRLYLAAYAEERASRSA